MSYARQTVKLTRRVLQLKTVICAGDINNRNRSCNVENAHNKENEHGSGLQ
jgi:hypothetical protein